MQIPTANYTKPIKDDTLNELILRAKEIASTNKKYEEELRQLDIQNRWLSEEAQRLEQDLAELKEKESTEHLPYDPRLGF